MTIWRSALFERTFTLGLWTGHQGQWIAQVRGDEAYPQRMSWEEIGTPAIDAFLDAVTVDYGRYGKDTISVGSRPPAAGWSRRAHEQVRASRGFGLIELKIGWTTEPHSFFTPPEGLWAVTSDLLGVREEDSSLTSAIAEAARNAVRTVAAERLFWKKVASDSHFGVMGPFEGKWVGGFRPLGYIVDPDAMTTSYSYISADDALRLTRLTACSFMWDALFDPNKVRIGTEFGYLVDRSFAYVREQGTPLPND